MPSRKILGIALIVIGAFMLFFSDYIANQVAAGRLQIEQGQRSVNSTNAVFSNSQYTKPIGNVFTGSAQNRIDAGRAEVTQYQTLSNNLRIAGIIFIALGVGIFFLWKKRN